MKRPISRRKFIRHAAAATTGLAVARQLTPRTDAADAEGASAFTSQWHRAPDRVWLGSEFWANPLQDWRIAGGRIECVKAAPNRNVHLLTRQLGQSSGTLWMSVRVGRVGGGPLLGDGAFGFRVGIQGPLRDHRNSLVFGNGLNCGATARGGLFIGQMANARTGTLDLSGLELELQLAAELAGDAYKLTLSARDPNRGKRLGEISRHGIDPEQLIGNLALVANFGNAQPNAARRGAAGNANGNNPGLGQFWFADWRVGGSKVEAHDDRAFGPILFSQYTLSGGTLKMTAQMPPLSEKDDPKVRLQVMRSGTWTTLAEALIHPEARIATFRIENWDSTNESNYRLAYTTRHTDGLAREHFWTGTVRRDPVDAPVLTVADISCNAHYAFPNTAYVANVAKLDPDLLAFTGDQYYEPSGGYGVQRAPVDAAILDLLRKWYLHGWTWRELIRDRPSISIPDDHDVYQGNLWGEGGGPKQRTQEMGGYDMDPAWVNVVHRTQTSHHPDPFVPTPGRRGIEVYFGALTYGRVSFAILADRQFKSGPEGKVPPTGNRGDHVIDPKFDPKTADVSGLELLGERQMNFIRAWAADWRGAEMKAVVSQTIFTAMATTHGARRERLVADYDANGWPQTPRNAALRELRKCFAFHLAGDQHLGAVVHYGVDEHGDAGVAFAGPAMNNLYPRWFEPLQPGANRRPGAPENTGDFHDRFGHPLTVLAVANPQLEFRKTVLETEQDKASGFGVVRFDKRARTVTVECWPFLADPSWPGTQFPGWPVTVKQIDNYGRKAVAHLPALNIRGIEKPVLKVTDDATGELVYALRLPGPGWQPHVFAPGRYTIEISEPETGRVKRVVGLAAKPENRERLDVMV